MRKIITCSAAIFVLSLVFILPVVSANPNESQNFIEPLTGAESENPEVIDSHLKRMGFSDEELAKIPAGMKVDIASKGGKKILYKELDPEVVTYDEDGNKIVLEQSDIDIAQATDGDLTINAWAVSHGSVSSTENSYTLYANYIWAKTPLNRYTDVIAMAWQSKAVPYGAPEGMHYWYWSPNQPPHEFINEVDLQQIEGNSWKIDIISTSSPQDGWVSQTIRVPKTEAGTTGAIAIGYSHRFVPSLPGVSISWGSVSFDPSSFQTDLYDRVNFTY